MCLADESCHRWGCPRSLLAALLLCSCFYGFMACLETALMDKHERAPCKVLLLGQIFFLCQLNAM